MNIETFWQIIESCKPTDLSYINDSLKQNLSQLDTNEIAEFDELYTQHLKELWHWDNWAVAFIICGCNTEYDFLDFCNFVISRGEKFYSTLLKNPDSLFEYPLPEKDGLPYPYCDELDLVAGLLYEEKTEDELPYHQVVNYQPKGKRFKNKPKSLKADYPNLFNKYWQSYH